ATRAQALDFTLWLGVEIGGRNDLHGIPGTVPRGMVGLVLVFPPGTGTSRPKADFTGLLALKREGDALAEVVRQRKRALGGGCRLAVVIDFSETTPESARSLYVPVRDLIRDGTLDTVCIRGGTRFNYHRLKLLRAAPLQAGAGFDERALKPNQVAGLLQHVTRKTFANPTCDSLWLLGGNPETLLNGVRQAVAAWEHEQTLRTELEAAIARGEFVVDQEAAAEKCDDLATVHGVAQSFVPSRDGACPLVQVYAALRGCKGELPPPLRVELRPDADGKPTKEILGKTVIETLDFGHAPAYRWVSARFDPPVPLRKGQRYWIHLPPATHPEGNYVWRMIKNGATERGAAWSCRYKYGKHTWVFRVLLEKETAP
ncbi:MAG: hypothetical protein KAI66_02000, partial [Lentisphaeria bacterium]|nr:hypothetical protein [Lentisphaeria bacterium]